MSRLAGSVAQSVRDRKRGHRDVPKHLIAPSLTRRAASAAAADSSKQSCLAAAHWTSRTFGSAVGTVATVLLGVEATNFEGGFDSLATTDEEVDLSSNGCESIFHRAILF